MGLDVPLKDVTVIGADSISTQHSGWYFYEYHFQRSLHVSYEKTNMFIPHLFIIRLDSVFCDQYLVIDGQMIWFIDEALGDDYHYDWKVEDIVEEDGTPTKVYTFSVWNVFYGKKFSATGIVTVYQLKDGAPSAAPSADTAPKSQWLSPMQPAQTEARQKGIAPKGEYRFGFISGGDIHGRGKGPRPFTAADDLRSAIKRQGVKVEMK